MGRTSAILSRPAEALRRATRPVASRIRAGLAGHIDLFVAVGGTLIAAALNLAATRGERAVSWDAFQYISLARTLSQHVPDHLGGHYPFGFPLLAAPLVAAGVHPYLALVSLSLIAYGILLFAMSRALGADERTRALRIFVPALGLIPLVFQLAGDAMSESLFMLLVFLAAFLMTKWKRPAEIYLTALVIVLAFAVRYAGIFLLPASVAWLARDRLTAREFPLRHAMAAIAIAAASIALLLYSNVAATGFVSGGPPEPGDRAFGALIHHLADFGFGAIGIFSGGMFVRLSQNPAVELATGLLCLVFGIGLALSAFRAGKSALAAACGIVVLCYIAAIVVLQSVTSFSDPSRYLVPAVPPLFVVVLVLLNRRRALAGITATLCIVAAIAVVRGVSTERNADLTAAADFLQPRLGPTARVLVNVDALSIAARLDGRIFFGFPNYDPRLGYVFMIDPPKFAAQRGDYLVIGTVRYERQTGKAPFAGPWERYLQAQTADGSARIAYRNRNAIVAEFVR